MRPHPLRIFLLSSHAGDTVIFTEAMKMNVMKQFLDAFTDGKLASGGDGVNGIALPGTSDFMDTFNTTIQALSTMVCHHAQNIDIKFNRTC